MTKERSKASTEFLGYLSTVLPSPDPDEAASTDGITFSGEDLLKWTTEDRDLAKEWREVPVDLKRTKEGVRVEGDFRRVAAIDSLSPDDPRYWVPLSTLGFKDKRFPIDVDRYPIIEVTYRCTSRRAHPTWLWTYEGGSHFGALPKGREWHTVARNVQHFGFPSRVDAVILRLYSPTRTVESFEVASVRFRAMSQTEAAATQTNLESLEDKKQKKQFPILDEFMPLGVYMDAESARRLANMLGITTEEYWGLVMEDMVAHHHNAIALAHVDQLEPKVWSGMLSQAKAYGIRFVPRHEYLFTGSEEEQAALIESHIRPFADSEAIVAHSLSGEPMEQNLGQVLAAKEKMEEADPNHPVAVIARYPNAYPLFAPFFAASGVGHFTARRPWDLGTMVRTHAPLSEAQQFWVAAPAFMYPTQTPEWSTCPEMRLMVNLAFASGARGWFAYSYHNDPVWLRGRVQRTLTGPFLTFSDLWGELAQRMKHVDAFAPLFLNARPVDPPDDWFLDNVKHQPGREPEPGIPAISQFQLHGPDYDLFITLSNNVREMIGIDVVIPAGVREGLEFHDLSEYFLSNEWKICPTKRHIELFPGQATIVLMAKPECCDYWRGVITGRLIATDLRKLEINLKLARTYNLHLDGIEKQIEGLRGSSNPEDLLAVRAMKDTLQNRIYASPDICEARSKIIEGSAALCACDGALCRLMQQGKTDIAGQLGNKVVPLARAFTKLRLELRRGNGAKIVGTSERLARETLVLLAKIRDSYSRGP